MRCFAIVGIVAALVGVPFALGQECVPTAWQETIAVGTDDTVVLYLARDCDLDCDTGDVGSSPLRSYLYEESNGIPGLQRLDDEVDNTCGGMVDPDTRLD